MNIMTIVIDLIEVVIALIGLAIALGKKKTYGWIIALSYLLYVASDIVHFMKPELSESTISAIWLIASPIMLIALWMIYKEK